MTDETAKDGGGDTPDAADREDAAAGSRLLDEQQARIAALRAAVLSGRIRDDDGKGFDYETFFADRGPDPAP